MLVVCHGDLSEHPLREPSHPSFRFPWFFPYSLGHLLSANSWAQHHIIEHHVEDDPQIDKNASHETRSLLTQSFTLMLPHTYCCLAVNFGEFSVCTDSIFQHI